MGDATVTTNPARPFVKWAGGKRQLLPEIRERLPATITDYHEPFVGSGALFFDLVAKDRIRGTAHLADSNATLIGAYEHIRDRVEELIDGLRELAAGHDPDDSDFYYARRDRFNEVEVGKLERSVLFIYLNRTCFNGLYRVNRSGGFNVPVGSYKNPTICDHENLRAVSEALEGVEIEACDFRKLGEEIEELDEDAFVYFDPPYHPLNATSDFTSYTKGDFGPADQEALAELYMRLTDADVRALLSNSCTEFVEELYAAHRIDGVEARRSINSKGSKRGGVSEVLVSNYPLPES